MAIAGGDEISRMALNVKRGQEDSFLRQALADLNLKIALVKNPCKHLLDDKICADSPLFFR